MPTIDTITKRRKLAVRREPYWHKLGIGKYIGFRKLDEKSGSWVARRQIGNDKKYLKIGSVNELEFEEACSKALAWLGAITDEDTLKSSKLTIKGAVTDYIEHLRVHNSPDAAYRTSLQLDKHFLPKLGPVEINKLTTAQLNSWFNALPKASEDEEEIRKSKDSANRTLTMVKAALNLAYTNGHVTSDVAWKRVKPFKNVAANRKVFLTDKQLKSLLSKLEPDLHDLAVASVLTGTRPSELYPTTKDDLNLKEGTLHITSGKTASRIVYLSDKTVNFFKKLTDSKSTEKLLFTDNGNKWKTDNYQRAFSEAVKKSKAPKGTVFYSFRHYHISKALTAGVAPQVIAENCGTSIRMLERHYGKFMKSDRHKMLNRMSLPNM